MNYTYCYRWNGKAWKILYCGFVVINFIDVIIGDNSIILFKYSWMSLYYIFIVYIMMFRGVKYKEVRDNKTGIYSKCYNV
jgi:hypothetical protein